jgi:hypothetical protein
MTIDRSRTDARIDRRASRPNQTEILGNVWPCAPKAKKILDARDRRAHSGFHKLAREKDYIPTNRARELRRRSMIIRKSKGQLDEELNEALKETFPGSDAVAIDASLDRPIRPIGRRPPRIDKALVEDLAREVRKSHARSSSQ